MGAGGAFLFPQPRQHQLQEGCLDPRLAGAGAVDHARSGTAELDVADPHLVEHRFDQARLDLHALIRGYAAVVFLQRPHDRLAGCLAAEAVYPQVVAEQVGDPSLEPVEPRERVLADRDEE